MEKGISVFGATGGQGGGVVSALLKAIGRGENYAVRALTRNPEGAKGQELKSKGCEVVKCDLDDKNLWRKRFMALTEFSWSRITGSILARRKKLIRASE